MLFLVDTDPVRESKIPEPPDVTAGSLSDFAILESKDDVLSMKRQLAQWVLSDPVFAEAVTLSRMAKSTNTVRECPPIGAGFGDEGRDPAWETYAREIVLNMDESTTAFFSDEIGVDLSLLQSWAASPNVSFDPVVQAVFVWCVTSGKVQWEGPDIYRLKVLETIAKTTRIL